MALTKERIEARAALRPLKQPLFDTGVVLVAPAVNLNVSFFQAQLGQPITPGGVFKTEADTNLTQGGQIGRPQEFDLYGMQIEVWMPGNVGAFTIGDLGLMYNQSVYEFFFGTQRPWLQTPADRVANGPGIEGTVATANDAVPVNYAFKHNGIGSGAAMYEFTIGKKPIPIGSAENFSARWSFRPAGITLTGASTRVRNFLKGILYAAL